MRIKLLGVIFLLLVVQNSFTQIFPGENIDIIVNGDTLNHPWLGGLDLPQFSGGDINRDGNEDILIFDKKANKVLVLLKNDDGSYKYAPDLESVFPVIRDFALFRDYNCDGLVDIFCQTNGGIQVYKQNLVAGEINFELVEDQIKFDYNGFPINLYNVNGDIPGIEDVDGDGDLDIVVFPLLSGSVGLYRNISQESGYGCDSLIYEEYASCWGYFKENNANNQIDFDISCKGGGNNGPTLSGAAKHIGSTILLFDPNEDNKMDMLLGDVSFNSLVYLENDNTSLDAHMDINAVDYTYPSYDTIANVEVFPAAFYLDVTNDGKKDLLVAPCSNDDPSVNTTSSWLYENTGDLNEPFSFVKKNFLIDECIDLGSYSFPTFFDHNGDGLLDLIVANGNIFQTLGSTISTLHYYENVGTDTLPLFELKDENYLNFRSFNSSFLRPTFGDLDNDGDLDLIIGDREGYLNYFENTAGVGNPAVFSQNQLQYFNIDVGDFAHPQLIDVNNDSLLDLVVGRAASMGNIAYYWNFGTVSSPMYSVDSVNNAFGNVTTNEPGFLHGYSSPFVLKTDTQDYLYTGSDLGYISKYLINPDSLKSGTFYMEAPNLLASKVGIRTNVSILDINNDGASDYFIGNSRGGVSFYAEKAPTDTTVIDTGVIAIKEIDNYLNFSLYPNPSNGIIYIELENTVNNFNIEIMNVLGQVILTENKTSSVFQMNVNSLIKGVYYVKIMDKQGRSFVKSFLKS